MLLMSRDGVLLEMALLALMLAGCGGTSSSEAIPFQQQILQVEKETDPEVCTRRLIKIGYQQGKARDMAGADDTLRLAGKDCSAIRNAADRAGATALLAEAYVGLGNRSAAARTIESAAAAADTVKDAESKDSAGAGGPGPSRRGRPGRSRGHAASGRGAGSQGGRCPRPSAGRLCRGRRL